MEMVVSCAFLFSKVGKFKTCMAQVSYNQLQLYLLVCSLLESHWKILALSRFLYRPHCTQCSLPQPQPNIPQYSSRARSVEVRIKHLAGYSDLQLGVSGDTTRGGQLNIPAPTTVISLP